METALTVAVIITEYLSELLMSFSQWLEAGVVLILVKALVEPTAVHVGQGIYRWLDNKLHDKLPDYLRGDDND